MTGALVSSQVRSVSDQPVTGNVVPLVGDDVAASPEVLAAELYAGHPAAAELIRCAVAGPTPEIQRRAALALAQLDPDWPDTTSLDGVRTALADIMAALVYSSDRRERVRAASLLVAVCKVAESMGAA
jgi:hypothetical protein